MDDLQPAALSSLEVPTMVSGGDAPVMAIIEHLSAAECRMRSVHAFAIGTQIDFDVAVHGAPTVSLRGTIVSRKQNGARFAYVTTIQSGDVHVEAIAKANDAARARARTEEVQTGTGLTRVNQRVAVDFVLHYSRHGSETRTARATNISTGGVHMNTPDEIPVGAAIEMELPLENRRLSLRGRVVAHQALSPNYNVAFFEITNEARENLARFIAQQAA
ncbi:MAG TPA: PilZ domain-containing protein [Candidatus Acidoferrales bacterium]|nr:PilZ domain-containing protein [Candidatus Acidoferrales bacterium]